MTERHNKVLEQLPKVKNEIKKTVKHRSKLVEYIKNILNCRQIDKFDSTFKIAK